MTKLEVIKLIDDFIGDEENWSEDCCYNHVFNSTKIETFILELLKKLNVNLK